MGFIAEHSGEIPGMTVDIAEGAGNFPGGGMGEEGSHHLKVWN